MSTDRILKFVKTCVIFLIGYVIAFFIIAAISLFLGALIPING